jgi:uncharacterized protein (DUF58 family)
MTQHVSVRRRLPDSATAGESFAVELVVTSKIKSLGIRLLDTVQRQARFGSRPGATATTPLVDAAGRSAKVHYRLILDRRGQYSFGPLQVRSSYPFGLVRRTVEHDLPGTLLVFPRLGVLTAAWSALFQQAAHGAERQRRQSYAAGDFYGLRDYRSGDSRRHIHWRTSARRGNLMVRLFERALHQDVAICLDLWQPNQRGDEDRAHVERAISFAATLVNHLCRRGGCDIWLSIAAAHEPPLQGAASSSLAREALTRLARAEAPDHDVSQSICISALAQAPRRAMRVLLTTRAAAGQAALSSQIAAENGDNGAHGRLVVVSTRDATFADLFRVAAPLSTVTTE